MDTPSTPEDADEAMRPLREAGQGEAEGFELAEQDLIENATHGDDAGEGIPRLEELGSHEAEPDVAVYGEADEEEPRDA
ncbi:MAG TPA: hypothetical protein VNB64_03285 [Solirubrobacteraceae bacterium]|nr:hypothetical protein [Solirubrobacteraceae bacterium]